MMTKTLQGFRVRAVQQGGWRYEGKVLVDHDDFIEILDEKTQKQVILRRDTLLVLEELNG